jgi:hypothetical protein
MHKKAAQYFQALYGLFFITEQVCDLMYALSVGSPYDFLATSAVFSVSAFLAFAVFGVQHLSPLLLALDFVLHLSVQDLSPCAEATANETEAIATTATNERSAFMINS